MSVPRATRNANTRSPDKIYGFLEIASRSGRSGTNGNSGAEEEKPWVGIHKALALSMIERLEPYRLDTTTLPENMRGCYEECQFSAPILTRRNIDMDPTRSTGLVTFDLQDTGITFQPGDRLAVMLMNSWMEVAKMVASLGLEDFMETKVPLDLAPEWQKFAKHIASVQHVTTIPSLSVRDILRRGHLAPLTKDPVVSVSTWYPALPQRLLDISRFMFHSVASRPSLHKSCNMMFGPSEGQSVISFRWLQGNALRNSGTKHLTFQTSPGCLS